MKLVQKISVAWIRLRFKVLTFFSKKLAAKKAVELFCTPLLKNKKDLPAIFQNAEQLQFDLEGTTIHGFRWNHPAPRKVLILHGFDSSAVNFEQYVNPLLDKGYEVMAFDAPAHGKSGGDIITAPAYRDMIIAIHRKFGPIQSFVAHSMGGLALSLAVEKINHDASYRLAFIAPATESVTAIDNFLKFLKIKNRQVRKEFDSLILAMSGKPAEWYSITRAMPAIKASVLWAHDRDDKVTPLTDALKVKEANYTNVNFVITSGLGHRRIYRDEKVAEAVVNFL